MTITPCVRFTIALLAVFGVAKGDPLHRNVAQIPDPWVLDCSQGKTVSLNTHLYAVAHWGDLQDVHSVSSMLKQYDGMTGSCGEFANAAPWDMTLGADGSLYTAWFVCGWPPSSIPSLLQKYDVATELCAPFGLAPPYTSGPWYFTVGGPNRNVFVTNHAGSSVLEYDGRNGAFLGIFVTSGSGGLSNAGHLTFGPDGNLFVVSNGNILKYDGSSGAFLGVFTRAGDGAWCEPCDLTFGPDRNLYVSSWQMGVLKYDGATGAPLGVFVGPGSGGLTHASGLAFARDGNLYVASYSVGVLSYDGVTGEFRGLLISDRGIPDTALVIEDRMNVSSDVTVTRGPFTTGRPDLNWTATLTVTNTNTGSGRTGRAAEISAPIHVVLTTLSPNATMLNNTGMYQGSPYITVSVGSLSPGNSVSVQIEFANSTGGPITYVPVTYSGVI